MIALQSYNFLCTYTNKKQKKEKKKADSPSDYLLSLYTLFIYI